MKTRFMTSAVALALGSLLFAQSNPVAEARRKAMLQTTQTIQGELKAHGGDWEAWYKELGPFRNALTALMQGELRPAPGPGYIPNGILRAEGKPPLFMPTNTAWYLANSDPALSGFSSSRPSPAVITAFAQWLRLSGIDLILVPAPKMAEVYPDRTLAKETPADRIVAPQMRKFLLDFAAADIEVVDLLPAFLAEARKPGEPLFLPADTHWSNRAQQIAANLIGERLKRYPFVQQALGKPSLYTSQDVQKEFKGYIYGYLNAKEREEVQGALVANATVVSSNGNPFQESDDASVLVIGDSFTNYFNLAVQKGSGIDALLAKTINMQVGNVSTAAATTQPLKDLARDPGMLRNTKVVIWVSTNDLLAINQSWAPWDVVPFPPATQTR